MKTWLRWTVAYPLLLLLVAVVTVQLLRLFAVGSAGREALALVEVAPPEVTGSNGFQALFLSDYEVPLDQLDPAMRVEVGHFERWLQENGTSLAGKLSAAEGATTPAVPDAPTPAARWPKRAAFKANDATCSMNAMNCLERVQQAPEPVRELLVREAARLEYVDQALAADHFRTPYPEVNETPLPPHATLRLALMRASLDAVEGRVPESLSRSCRLLGASRRFSTGATDLIARMVFSASGEGAVNLLMQVRREHPDVALPQDCAEALAPVRAEDFLICESLRGDYRTTRSVSRRLVRGLEERGRPADIGVLLTLYHGPSAEAWLAATYADTCTDEYRDQVLAGTVPAYQRLPITFGDPTCYGAYISCILAQIASPDYGRYQLRLLDQAAKLRLALASMAVADGSLTREAALRQAASPGYPLQIDEDTGTVAVELRSKPGKGQDRLYRVTL